MRRNQIVIFWLFYSVCFPLLKCFPYKFIVSCYPYSLKRDIETGKVFLLNIDDMKSVNLITLNWNNLRRIPAPNVCIWRDHDSSYILWAIFIVNKLNNTVASPSLSCLPFPPSPPPLHPLSPILPLPILPILPLPIP